MSGNAKTRVAIYRNYPKSTTSHASSSAVDAYGEERLVELGGQALRTAATQVLFTRKPFMSAEDIVERRKEILSNANVESLITAYRLREKLRCHPDAISSLHAPEEARRLFNSYFGAVFAEGGFDKICGWMRGLLDHGFINEDESPPPCLYEPPPPKKVKVQETSPVIPPRLLRSRTPCAAATSTSSVTPVTTISNPLAPAQPHLPFLQSFNQAAHQRQVTVEFLSKPSVLQDTNQWAVKCVANGIEVGIGYGSSKQAAKEEAARQAFYAMGWAPHG